jgi:acetolactate synthase-1/2/3 large subunit
MTIYTGGEIIVKYLIKENIPYVVGIPGHANLGLVDAFYKYQDSIKVIQPKQENCAVHLAVGYYRVTGKPLVVFTSIGPGATNTAIGLADAFVDSMPVLVLTGDTHVHMRGKGVLQEIERKRDSDFPRILEPLCKRTWQLAKVEQLPNVMQRAFNQMLTGRRGPVHIDLPMDVQCASIDCEIPEPLERRPIGKPLGDPELIEESVKLIRNSKRPIILIGGGIVSANGFDELKTLVEIIGAPVITTMMAKSAFPNDHPLFGWHTGSKGTSCGLELSSKADLIIAIGCRFADETTSSYKHGISFTIPPTKLIQIDIDPSEIGKNYPVSVGIVGDAKAVIKQLLQKFNELNYKVDYKNTLYYSEIQSLKEKWFKFLNDFRDDSKTPVMISTALSEIRKFFKKDAIFISSSGNVQAQMLQEFSFYEPKTCITAGGFSTMGYTLPAAIGVKLGVKDLGKPETEVVGLVGDGDFMMSMQELSTASQLKLKNFFIIIFNNMGWIAIKDLQQAAYGEDRAWANDFYDIDGNVYSPNFAEIAKAFGCFGERISKREEIITTLEKAAESGKPAIIEILVNREFPYTGSPAVGWWDVPKPTYLMEQRKKYEEEIKEEKL